LRKLTLFLLFLFALLALAPAANAQIDCPPQYWEGASCYYYGGTCYNDFFCDPGYGVRNVFYVDCYGYDPSIGQFNTCTYQVSWCDVICNNPYY
jgi:hypothetical protein